MRCRRRRSINCSSAKCSKAKSSPGSKAAIPYVFGRGGEEAQELHAAGCPFEVVPGISSTIAGPAYAGIPVTHRDFNTQLTIFTGHEDPTKEVSSLDFAKIAQADGVKVMLMGVGRMGELTGKLMDQRRRPGNARGLIRWATTGRQQTLTGTLATIADLGGKARIQSPGRLCDRRHRGPAAGIELVRTPPAFRKTHRGHPHPEPGGSPEQCPEGARR